MRVIHKLTRFSRSRGIKRTNLVTYTVDMEKTRLVMRVGISQGRERKGMPLTWVVPSTYSSTFTLSRRTRVGETPGSIKTVKS